MDTLLNRAMIPFTFQELFLEWSRSPDAVIYAGGTNILGRQEKNILSLPPAFICLDKMSELHNITRTEHYLEIGAMAKLNRIINLGKIIPQALRTCLEKIGGYQLRNVATIGGNICSLSRNHGFADFSQTVKKPKERIAGKDSLLDLPAPLAALDAQYELRCSPTSARWVSALRFHTAHDICFSKQELLTRIRLPIHQWDYSVYKKFFSEDYFNTEALVFLAKTRKNILSEIKVIYKSGTIIRNKSAEDILNGKFLPLNRKTADDFMENWREFLKKRDTEPDLSKNTLLNAIRENVQNLSE